MMRSRTPQATGPTSSNETSARKHSERQLFTDAAGGGQRTQSIDWNPAQTIAPALLASQRIQLRPWTEANRDPFAAMGLASEAAFMALRAGFESLGLDKIVAVTTLHNTCSRAVMQRLGMRESPAAEFDHPAFPPDSLERHLCVYRLIRARWSDNLLVNVQTQG
jgi:hypothetical protein